MKTQANRMAPLSRPQASRDGTLNEFEAFEQYTRTPKAMEPDGN